MRIGVVQSNICYNAARHISVAKAVKVTVTDMTNREYIIITTNKTRQIKLYKDMIHVKV